MQNVKRLFVFVSAAVLLYCANGCKENISNAPPSPGTETDKMLQAAADVIVQMSDNKDAVKDIYDAASAYMYAGGDESVSFSALMNPAKDNLLKTIYPVNGFKYLFEANLRQVRDKKTSSAIRHLISQNKIELYWPYSVAWNGTDQPVVAAILDDVNKTVGYIKTENGIQQIMVDDEYCQHHPVLFVRSFDESAYKGIKLQTFKDQKEFMSFRNYAEEARVSGLTKADAPRAASGSKPLGVAATFRQINVLGFRAQKQSYHVTLNKNMSYSLYYVCEGDVNATDIGNVKAIGFTGNTQSFYLPKSFFLNIPGTAVTGFRLANVTLMSDWDPTMKQILIYIFRKGSGFQATASVNVVTLTTVFQQYSASQGLNLKQTINVTFPGFQQTTDGQLTQSLVSHDAVSQTWQTSYTGTVTVTDADFMLGSFDLDRDAVYAGAQQMWVRNGAGKEPQTYKPNAKWSGPFLAYKLDNYMMSTYISIIEGTY